MIPVNLELVKELWLPNIFIYNLKTFKVRPRKNGWWVVLYTRTAICSSIFLYRYLHGQCHKNVDPNMYRQYFRIVPCTYLPWRPTQHPLCWVIVLCTCLLWSQTLYLLCWVTVPCTYLMWSQTLIFYAESLHYVNSCCEVRLSIPLLSQLAVVESGSVHPYWVICLLCIYAQQILAESEAA